MSRRKDIEEITEKLSIVSQKLRSSAKTLITVSIILFFLATASLIVENKMLNITILILVAVLFFTFIKCTKEYQKAIILLEKINKPPKKKNKIKKLSTRT